MNNKKTPIQTVHNIAQLLRCFTESNGELGVMEISRRLDMHKSTVSRLLASLLHEGFVDKNSITGKYQLGLNLVHLASFVLERLDLRVVARPYLEELADHTQETVNIAVLDREMCLNIESIISPKPIQHAGKLGARYPLYCTSTGRVLLSNISLEKRELLLSIPRPLFTEKTIIDLHDLEEILEDVQIKGYSIVHEEYQEGLSAVAAPIRGHTGQVAAAVSVSGPTYRFNAGKLDEIVTHLTATAGEISVRLGGKFPQ